MQEARDPFPVRSEAGELLLAHVAEACEHLPVMMTALGLQASPPTPVGWQRLALPYQRLNLLVRVDYCHSLLRFDKPDPAREELLHHALLDGAGLVPAAFQGGDFGVHVGEDGGDGALFIRWR